MGYFAYGFALSAFLSLPIAAVGICRRAFRASIDFGTDVD